MKWEQLKSELQEAIDLNVIATMSPHTVMALMLQVEDMHRLITDFDKAVTRWMCTDDDGDWPAALADLTRIQDSIQELRFNQEMEV